MAYGTVRYASGPYAGGAAQSPAFHRWFVLFGAVSTRAGAVTVGDLGPPATAASRSGTATVESSWVTVAAASDGTEATVADALPSRGTVASSSPVTGSVASR